MAAQANGDLTRSRLGNKPGTNLAVIRRPADCDGKKKSGLNRWYEKDYAQRWTCCGFRCRRIKTARLKAGGGKDAEVEAEFHRPAMRREAELLQTETRGGVDVLSESEHSCSRSPARSGAFWQNFKGWIAGAGKPGELHGQARGRDVGELQSAFSNYADKVDVDPAALAELEERLTC